MRTIDFDGWKKQKSRVFETMIRTESSFEGRVPGRRPRDPEKERILSELDKVRWLRWLQSGKLAKLGPRHYRLRIDFKDREAPSG